MQLTIENQTNHPLPEARPEVNLGVVWMARLGYASKGAVFIVLGLMVIERTLKLGSSATDLQGALRVIGQQPLGVFPLSILVVGLVGYAIWEVLRALVDPERLGRTFRGLARRAGFFAPV